MGTNKTTELERSVARLTERAEGVAVGRAAWGLFILLSLWKKKDGPQKIAMPSFLCQSPLAAVLLAGWEPVFCDVDVETGNVSPCEWDRVLDADIHAVLFVHLFGNVGDAERVADMCRLKGVLFIEDAAQALGGNWRGKPCGTFGDAAIVSFGHTKLIDVGQGGMVLTNDPVLADDIRCFDSGHAAISPDRSQHAQWFREKFYAARHRLASSPESAKASFSGLLGIYQSLVPSKWDAAFAEEILMKLNNLPALVRGRQEKNQFYNNMFRGTALVPLTMSAGSVPWRAVVRLPGIGWAEQDEISNAVRAEGVDISNWYVPSDWMMERKSTSYATLGSTEQLSKEVFQLWVDESIDHNEMERAATVLMNKISDMSLVLLP